MRASRKPRKDLQLTLTAMCMRSARRECRGAMAHAQDYRLEELLAAVIARLTAGARHAAIGAASPIPAAGALLARERGNGRPRVSLLGSRRQNFFSDGGRELFDCAGQGRIDVLFLSGGQIDGHGNINLVGSGGPAE